MYTKRVPNGGPKTPQKGSQIMENLQNGRFRVYPENDPKWLKTPKSRKTPKMDQNGVMEITTFGPLWIHHEIPPSTSDTESPVNDVKHVCMNTMYTKRDQNRGLRPPKKGLILGTWPQTPPKMTTFRPQKGPKSGPQKHYIATPSLLRIRGNGVKKVSKKVSKKGPKRVQNGVQKGSKNGPKRSKTPKMAIPPWSRNHHIWVRSSDLGSEVTFRVLGQDLS
jgi:hypothetical protein